jgi:hypothetical protein
VRKNGRYGKFLGCSNWPLCDGARDLKPIENRERQADRWQDFSASMIQPCPGITLSAIVQLWTGTSVSVASVIDSFLPLSAWGPEAQRR